MALLRIEVFPIQVMGLGYFRMDHLNLALQPTLIDHRQQYWRSMEGGFDESPNGKVLALFGEDGRTSFSKQNGGLLGAELAAAIGTPAQRNSTIIEPVTGENIWWRFQPHAVDIEAEHFPYIAFGFPSSATPTVNSSSVIASLLYYGGVDIREWNPIGFLRFSPGTNTLLGDNASQTLQTDGNFHTLMGGGGNDILVGSEEHSIEKMYGGRGNDIFIWSPGINIYHGGQPRLDYLEDGIDRVNYTGIGEVYIKANPIAFPHTAPDFFAFHTDGVDWLFSIEDLAWDAKSDIVIFDENVGHADKLPMLKLHGQDGGQGDKVSFENSTSGLLINATDDGGYLLITDQSSANLDDGMWVESAEWIIGSESDDKFFATSDLRGMEGGGGNDFLDAQSVLESTKLSPGGYDVEIYGGAGNDTLVSNFGTSLLAGGSGADSFVVSSLSWNGSLVEIVITDAESSDRLYVPHNYFNNSDFVFEGSELLPVLGGIAGVAGKGSFEDLDQNSGTWTSNTANAQNFTQLYVQTQEQQWAGGSPVEGVIFFQGAITYDRDGSDLMIHIFEGYVLEIDNPGIPGDGIPAYTEYVNGFIGETETIVRVKNFSDGDLGIHFYDPGEPEVIEVNGQLLYDYPNWNEAVFAITNGGSLTAPLELQPVAPVYEAPESDESTVAETNGDNDANTIASLEGPSRVNGGGGDDTITTGNSNDVLNGGTGVDTLHGGRGNDTYSVDEANDVVEETSGQGFDHVYASVSYELSSHVEYLDLTGLAMSGTGNDQDNRIVGNDLDNILIGKGGNDKLAGLAGNDVVDGGSGNDIYIYSLGDGDDRIQDSGGSKDILSLIGINSGDVQFFVRTSAPNDVVMAIEGGGTVVFENMLSGSDRNIDKIVFDDQSELLRAAIIAEANAAPMVANDAPQANRDIGLAIFSGTAVISALALLDNDRDADGGLLTIMSVVALNPGISVSLNASGNIVVITPDNYTGPADFRYTLSDGQGATDEAVVEIDVLVNHRPETAATITTVGVNEAAPFIFQLPTTLFTDADGDEIFVSATLAGGGALPAWLTFDAETGQFSGTPPLGASGSLSITLTASDGRLSITKAIEFVIGATSGGIIGTDGDDRLTGGEGNTTIDGRAGTDTLDYSGETGGLGVRINLSAGPFNINVGGVTVDVIPAGHGRDTSGNTDTLTSIENLIGTAHADTLVGSADANTLSGRNGNDLLSGLAGDDTLEGGDGNDILIGGLGADTLDGGNNDDSIVFDGNDTIRAGAGNDYAVVADHAAAAGVSMVFSDPDGLERVIGNFGNDTFDASAKTVRVSLDGRGGNDILIGGSGNDLLNGGLGADILKGGSNDDVFVFDGDDTILAGAGNDYAVVADHAAAAGVFMAFANTDELERVIGGVGNDTFDAAAKSVRFTLDGRGGNDILTGGSGSDLLNGGDGADVLRGNSGNDYLTGGAGDDVFAFSNNWGYDLIQDFNKLADAVDLSSLTGLESLNQLAPIGANNGSLILRYQGNTIVLANTVASDLVVGDNILL